MDEILDVIERNILHSVINLPDELSFFKLIRLAGYKTRKDFFNSLIPLLDFDNGNRHDIHSITESFNVNSLKEAVRAIFKNTNMINVDELEAKHFYEYVISYIGIYICYLKESDNITFKAGALANFIEEVYSEILLSGGMKNLFGEK